MKKNLQLCIDMYTYLQNDSLPVQDKPYLGVLTQLDDDMVCFVENEHKAIHRNPCLYNGKRITLTLQRDGQPRFNFKRVHMGPGFDEKAFALELLNDVLLAFECLVEK